MKLKGLIVPWPDVPPDHVVYNALVFVRQLQSNDYVAVGHQRVFQNESNRWIVRLTLRPKAFWSWLTRETFTVEAPMPDDRRLAFYEPPDEMTWSS